MPELTRDMEGLLLSLDRKEPRRTEDRAGRARYYLAKALERRGLAVYQGVAGWVLTEKGEICKRSLVNHRAAS